MKIVLIGAGKVAGSLGQLWVQNGHQILQVINRSTERGQVLAASLNAAFTSSYAEILPDADLYVVALSDQAIPELMLKWQQPIQLVVHTAGTVPMSVLQGISARTGVLYPLQSLTGNLPVSGSIPFLLQANANQDLELLKQLVSSTGNSWQTATDQQRLQMHVSAVWVNNFPNLLYSIAYRLCQDNQLSFELLLPLIRETGLRLQDQSGSLMQDPFLWQTGPAMREDQHTIRRHLETMNPHPDWKDLYEHLTEEIISLKSQQADAAIQSAE